MPKSAPLCWAALLRADVDANVLLTSVVCMLCTGVCVLCTRVCTMLLLALAVDLIVLLPMRPDGQDTVLVAMVVVAMVVGTRVLSVVLDTELLTLIRSTVLQS